MTTPRGIRNNNATNIEHHTRNAWQGLAVPPSDGRFCRFVAPQWGLRATILILRKYQARGQRTINQMIAAWAPHTENDVSAYLQRVCSRTGLRAHDVPDLADKAQTIALLKAMVAVECGPAPAGTANGDWLDDAVYQSAWSLAQPLAGSRTVRGSVAAGVSAAAGAVLEVAQEVLPQAADAASTAGAVWPEVARWVLIGVCLAGAALAFR
ncbi:MAG: hypothetical protein NHG36_14710, partial [Chromatiaceae bacterium]|nr:hypothetical protein [Candidatus Thioaporhodococcus sediminis]